MKLLKYAFPNILSSRYASRLEDDNCVDLVNTEDFAFQCKAMSVVPPLKQVFSDMKTNKTKVILWKNTRITGNSGEFAIMKLEDYTDLLNDLIDFKENGRNVK